MKIEDLDSNFKQEANSTRLNYRKVKETEAEIEGYAPIPGSAFPMVFWKKYTDRSLLRLPGIPAEVCCDFRQILVFWVCVWNCWSRML